MSYVEKAFWDYLKSTLFGGVRILFSKRLVLFSIILFIISATTTGVVVLQSEVSDLFTIGDFNLVDIVFMIQISIAIGFIISGLFSKKLNLLLRFILLLAIVIITLGVLLMDIMDITGILVQYFPLMAFLSWSFLVPLAAFGFSKGMFNNKITGSVLFLGKPKTDHKSIFSGLTTLIAFLSLIWNIIMTYIGFTSDPIRLSYLVLGIIGALVAILIILVVQGWIYNDDVFNTTLGFFFVMTLPNQIMIFLTSVSGSENIITSFDYIFVIFSLLYSAQNISRRVKMKGVVVDPTKKEKVKEDPFRIGRFIGFVGGEGVVLVYLGLALGFHLIQLQVMSGLANVYEDLFGGLKFSEAYHDITMVFMVIILLLVCAFYALQRGSGYWEADIYRFDFLPPYEDLVDYMERIKKGEISKTDIALTVGKKAVEASGVGIFSAAKKFRNRIFGEKRDQE